MGLWVRACVRACVRVCAVLLALASTCKNLKTLTTDKNTLNDEMTYPVGRGCAQAGCVRGGQYVACAAEGPQRSAVNARARRRGPVVSRSGS